MFLSTIVSTVTLAILATLAQADDGKNKLSFEAIECLPDTKSSYYEFGKLEGLVAESVGAQNKYFGGHRKDSPIRVFDKPENDLVHFNIYDISLFPESVKAKTPVQVCTLKKPVFKEGDQPSCGKFTIANLMKEPNPFYTVDKLTCYPRIKAEAKDGSVAYFPTEIPDDSKNPDS